MSGQMEVCSNTDQIDLPSWCVEMEFTVWTFLQLIAEIILLGLIAFTSYHYFRWRRQKKIEKKMAKRLNKQPPSEFRKL